MTPAEIISEVRSLVNDVRQPQRFSDTSLLGFVNQTVKRMVIFRPDIFTVYGEIATEANAVLQTLPADSARLVEIYQVKGGNTVTEVNRETLDQGYPSWVSDTPGTPYNYMRHVRNANKFFLYPRPIPGVVLIGEYVKIPTDYTINESIEDIPASFLPALVDGSVFLAASIDDEHVNSGRAKLFLESFTSMMSVGMTNRPLTDTETSGMNPKEVI